jgi:hypothetical protein
MQTFEPRMDREVFEREFRHASRFAVWVQVNTAVQMCLEITKEQAREIANFGFENGGFVWGQYNHALLELSITSQWYDQVKAKC